MVVVAKMEALVVVKVIDDDELMMIDVNGLMLPCQSRFHLQN
jgi:hypothetical protein